MFCTCNNKLELSFLKTVLSFYLNQKTRQLVSYLEEKKYDIKDENSECNILMKIKDTQNSIDQFKMDLDDLFFALYTVNTKMCIECA